VCAPDEVVRKVCYALEELLVAAGIPHRVNRADACDGWDLFYGDQPPGDGSLWMAASPAAWRFLTERGGRIDGVETVRTAGHWARLPDWNAGRPAGRDAVPAVTGAGRSPLPDLAAAAFFFLSHREEWGAPERDRFGRFPLSASVFGRGLWSLIECPVERYARALRQAVSERLPAEARLRSDPSTATMEGDEDEEIPAGQPRPAFLLGLSHDVDTVRRWDGRGFARTGRELLRALVRGHVQKAQAETRCLLAGIQARRNGRDPHDNLEQIVMLEREAGASSTFFLLARQSIAGMARTRSITSDGCPRSRARW